MAVFRFRQFDVRQEKSAMKVGTDALVLGALIETPQYGRVLDVGAGTGVITLMLAQRSPGLHFTSLEIDSASVAECRENLTASPWSDRIHAIEADFLQWEGDSSFDLIVSNPPYYQTQNPNQDERSGRARHMDALTPEAFFLRAQKCLNPNGRIWLIFPSDEEPGWTGAAAVLGFFPEVRVNIFGKMGGPMKRNVCCFSMVEGPCSVSELTIRDQDGSYTEAYIRLTKEYHAVDLRKQ